MKKVILILSIAFIGLSLSTNAQDVLKLKTINTCYGEAVGNHYQTIGELDGAVINMDSIAFLYPRLSVVNISNDTFSWNVSYGLTIVFLLYADTGLLLIDKNVSQTYSIFMEFFPNDTVDLAAVKFKLSDIIDYLREEENIEFEQISYWKMIAGVGYTSKDGTYSEDVFYAGADTSIFYLTRNPVSIEETEPNQANISVFPNPAQSQFTVSHAENAEIELYNLLGQRVKQIASTEENTIVRTDNLPAGMYILQVKRDNAVFTKKVQVTK